MYPSNAVAINFGICDYKDGLLITQTCALQAIAVD